MTKAKLPLPSQWLTLEQTNKLYDQLDKRFNKLKLEPLPPFQSRYPNRLESILGSAKLTADLQSFDIADLAAYYLVFIAKGHPLMDGNKRMAVACCLGYLWFEGHGLSIGPLGLYESTILLTQSQLPEEKLRSFIANAFRYQMFHGIIRDKPV